MSGAINDIFTDLVPVGINMRNLIFGVGTAEDDAAFQGIGYQVVAQRGINRVPGPPSMPVPALVHGGEMILNASDAASVRAGGFGGGVTVNFNLSSASDREMVQMLRAQLPMITSAVSDGIRRGAHFGTEKFDERMIRTTLQS